MSTLIEYLNGGEFTEETHCEMQKLANTYLNKSTVVIPTNRSELVSDMVSYLWEKLANYDGSKSTIGTFAFMCYSQFMTRKAEYEGRKKRQVRLVSMSEFDDGEEVDPTDFYSYQQYTHESKFDDETHFMDYALSYWLFNVDNHFQAKRKSNPVAKKIVHTLLNQTRIENYHDFVHDELKVNKQMFSLITLKMRRVNNKLRVEYEKNN